MKFAAIVLFVILVASGATAQRRSVAKPTPSPAKQVSVQTAVTKDGRTVLLKSDGTWEYSSDPVASQPASVSATPALKALRIMAGATEVGVNFEEYGRRLIDVKADVSRVVIALPDGELKSEIELAMAGYADAARAWNELVLRGRSIDRSNLYPDSDPLADALQKRYDIVTETVNPSEGMSAELLRITPPDQRKPFRVMLGRNVLDAIWRAALKHLEKAESVTK